MPPHSMESELWPLLEQFKDDLSDVSDALKPLLKNPLLDNASKLPLVDKAKLYVLTTYTIESLLFAYLELNNMNPKVHPLMKELTRVKQYFTKIKDAEAKTAGKNLSLDKEAAGRFIKHALSGNEEYDRQRAEDIARQKENAHIKFNELGEPIPVVKAKSPEPKGNSSEDEGDGLVIHGSTEEKAAATTTTSTTATSSGQDDDESSDSNSDLSPKEVTTRQPREKSKSHKQARKEKKRQAKEDKKARKKQKKSDSRPVSAG